MRNSYGRFRGNGACRFVLTFCLVCACGLSAPLAAAQETASPQESFARTRLLNAEEGRAIVNAAWEEALPARGTQDCSHLVHKIYASAGFEYPYASSFDIYAGSENFERVKTPQSGDVIAWRGHVGIVVDPAGHSFYSLVRSGLDAQDYDGPYWRSRGRPRFYRYVVGGPANLVAEKTIAPTRGTARTRPSSAATVAEEREEDASSPAKRSPTAASERTAVIYGPPAPVPAAAAKTVVEIPASIVIGEGQQKPTRQEVAEAILEVNDTAGSVLGSDEPLKPGLPVVIFDHLSVERVEFKRDRGWAHLQVDSRATIGSAGAVVKAKREKVLWELKRTESGWEAVTPVDRRYVPHDVAVRVLAQQLARLTESDGAAQHQDNVLRQEGQLASLLSALLEKK